MRVVILEPDASGHRLTYVRLIAQGLEPFPVDVTLATTMEAVERDEFARQIKPLTPKLKIAPICPPGSGVLGSAIARWRSLHRVFRDLRPEHLYIPYVDGLAQIMGVARLAGWTPRRYGCEIAALLMRGGFAYPQPTLRGCVQAQGAIRAVLLAPMAKLHVIDPLVFERLQRTFPRHAARISIVPDPVEAIEDIGKEEARRRLGVPVEGRIVSCSGLLDCRKGVDLLIKAFLRASLSQDVRLLLMGRATPPIRGLLDTEASQLVNSGRIIVIDRYVTDIELGWANIASDLVCTPYPRHVGSASIVIRAAAANRPVLGGDYGWIGYIVPRFNLGWLCVPNDVTDLTAILPKALDDSMTWAPSAATERFVRFHRVSNFQAHWTVGIRSRLGLPQRTDLITWEHVIQPMVPELSTTAVQIEQ